MQKGVKDSQPVHPQHQDRLIRDGLSVDLALAKIVLADRRLGLQLAEASRSVIAMSSHYAADRQGVAQPAGAKGADSPKGMRDRTRTGLLHSKALPPFASLKAFEAVGRCGGIRAAALALSLDHAVVSRHIRSLEDWLGMPLFRRSPGQLHLNDTGAAYHARISAAFAELASATAHVIGDVEHKRVKVWCVPGFATQWVAEQLADFQTDFPQFEVELRPTDSAANLMMHEADIDIRFYGDDWPPIIGGKGLRHIELARPPIIVVGSPEVAAKLSRLKSVGELVNAQLLHEEHHDQWRAWFRQNGVVADAPLPGVLMWHAHLALAAARRGRGIALANVYLVGADLKTGRLVEVVVPGARPLTLGAYAFVAREERWQAPAIVTLRQFLLARAKI